MTKKLKRFSNKAIIAATLCVVAAIAFIVGFVGRTDNRIYADDSFVFSGELRASYVKGEKADIPAAKLGDGVTAESYVIFPNGKCVKTDRAELSQTGIYTVEYRAEKNGKTFKDEKTFKVYDKLYYNDKSAALTEYDADREFIKNTSTGEKTTVSGIYTELMPGATFYYSKIFDISDKTKDDVIFECNVIATDDGNADFTQLTVRFTDAYDVTNYVDVVLWGNIRNELPQKDENYVRAGATDQITSAVTSSGKIYAGRFGLWTRTSLLNKHVFGDASRDVFDVRIDYATKSVYSSTRTESNFVIDLDDPKYFSNPWSGFKTGECTVSVFATNFFTSKGAVFIQKIFDDEGAAFEENYLIDKTAPTLTADFGDYNDGVLPFAVKGVPYKLFGFKAYDASGYVSPIKTDVYFNYYGSTPVKVTAENGYFVPQDAGVYTVICSAHDAFGNVTTELYDVNCEEKDEFAVTTAEKEITALTGEAVGLPTAEVTGASGKYTLKVYAEKNGESYDVSVDDMIFTPFSDGKYAIVYEAEDFLGRIRKTKAELAVTNGKAPVFTAEAFLNEYFIAGYEQTLPELYATDFSDGGKKIKAEIFVKEGDGAEIAVTDGVYKPSELTEDCAVSVTYKATGKNGVTEKRYSAKLRNIFGDKANKKIDKKSLFAEGSGVTADYATISSGDVTRYACYRADGELAVRYVNPIPAQDFSINLNVLAGAARFDAVSLYLSDVISGETIKISFERDGENSVLFSVNGGTKFPIKGYSFDKHDVSFNLSLNSVKKTIYTDNFNFSLAIKTNVDGREFKGFESGKIYLTVATEKVRGTSGIVIKKVYNQQLTDSAKDNIPPVLVLNGEYNKNVSLNETITIYPAVCQDLIEPETKAVLTVKTPSGKIAVAEDGTSLSRVGIGESYTIKTTEYGVYKLSYSIDGYSVPTEWAFTVVDETPPIITVKQNFDKSFKRGDSVSLEASATDDCTEDVQVFVCVNDYANMSEIITEKNYVFAREGVYEIIFFATDERGNYSFVKYVIDVRG